MNLSFFMKFGHRFVLPTILPTVRSLNVDKLVVGKNFHSMCENRMKIAPLLLKTTQTLLETTRGMKTKGKLNLRCKDCYFVWRQGRKFVMCKTSPRHKQQAIQKSEKNTWILTHATQSKIRPY